MSEVDKTPMPKGAELDPNIEVFNQKGTSFCNSGTSIWWHIKSDVKEHVNGVSDWLKNKFEKGLGFADPELTQYQYAASKGREDGTVLGSRFIENLNNPTDPLSIKQQTLIGDEDPRHRGGSFVLAQRFFFNWENLLNMSNTAVEDLVGRSIGTNVIIPNRNERAHIQRSRVQDEHGNTISVLRLGLPFGRHETEDRPDLLDKGASRVDERGLYFAGYCKSARNLQRIMASQMGNNPGYMADRLLGNVKANLGGLFYVPSQRELQQPISPNFKEVRGPLEYLRRLPGIDWTRLARHFTETSPNGWMHYSHKEYLYAMTTMDKEAEKKYMPPSERVLSLLADTFSRWQDAWYFGRQTPELHRLEYYLEHYEGMGRKKITRIMNSPVAVRSGWATKMLLGKVVAGDDWGFRGRRYNEHGTIYNGADTYYINPMEIIVGSMPNLSLAQGKYVIEFYRPDEELPNFMDGLGACSGIGHIVPNFKEVLEIGIGGIRARLEEGREKADESKRPFFEGGLIALEGVVDHLDSYAALAKKLKDGSYKSQPTAEKNLEKIIERLAHIRNDPPRNMAEAAQLIFTLHSCFHHVGEPTSVGRLDQLLYPFYLKDKKSGLIDDDAAQEILDCFWIKLGQKALLNRHFVEDHQPYGHLAMTGSASQYPQGSSLNQWIQQLTVGGTLPDEDDENGPGRPAYNELTRFALRAARRLPLNAPCLSLRVRKDMPQDILEEAAKAILSGGAHPIFLSDEKIIPGLKQSGDAIGDGPGRPTANTPVSKHAEGLWQSEVSLADARDYACDGCYEPQLPGKSWFTLGGMTMTQPLQCALNQGKLWRAAGPTNFHGKRISFMSPPASSIKTFDELMTLFYKHFKFLYAKQVDNQISVYGTMHKVCPAPLLSLFVEDCIAKGLDLYNGGSHYNVITPCFVGFSTLIDSLWAIKSMVFDPRHSVTSLPELVTALSCNWGKNMVEPFISPLQGKARIIELQERFHKLRVHAMSLPKFGRGNEEVDKFGSEIIGTVAQIAVDAFVNPVERTAEKMVAHARRLGTPKHKFGGFQIHPGCGTFENYLDWGNKEGASADGRLSRDPIASDISAAPSFGDLPIPPYQPSKALDVMKGMDTDGIKALWDSAPQDFNIGEEVKLEAVEKMIKAFADGKGSSLMTISCASPSTMEGASVNPEKYDIVRVRMGGWSEFFVAMFPAHQAQHERRLFVDVPEEGQEKDDKRQGVKKDKKDEKPKRKNY